MTSLSKCQVIFLCKNNPMCSPSVSFKNSSSFVFVQLTLSREDKRELPLHFSFLTSFLMMSFGNKSMTSSSVSNQALATSVKRKHNYTAQPIMSVVTCYSNANMNSISVINQHKFPSGTNYAPRPLQQFQCCPCMPKTSP